MKIRITELEEGKIFSEVISVNGDTNVLMRLYLQFANGLPEESRGEGDCQDALDLLRGLMLGAGNGDEFKVTDETNQKFRLYQDGDICYKQGKNSYLFINPVIQKI